MPLTDIKIRSVKPKSKIFKLFDSRGLYLEINPSGGKWWRWKYRFGGKEKLFSFGVCIRLAQSLGSPSFTIGNRNLRDYFLPDFFFAAQ